MEPHPLSTKRPPLAEGVAVLLLVLFSLFVGVAHLRSMRIDGHPSLQYIDNLYGPAVMLAYGHGFVSPDFLLYPKLHEFLKGERESFPRELLPDQIQEAPSSVASYHQYLLYVVGCFWKITGVSWKNLEILIAFFLVWYTLVLYGFMRLFLGRICSFLLTVFFILSPAVLSIIHDLRDFSKAPFIVTLLLILIWLYQTRLPLRRLLLMSLSVGIIHGIGLGFRQDLIVLVPFFLFALLIIAIKHFKKVQWRVFFPPLIFAFGFLLFAWPMLGRMEGGAQPQHILVQGFAADRMDQLGISQPPYQSLLSGSDHYTFAMLSDYALRKSGMPIYSGLNSKGAEKSGQMWLRESVLLFPADLIARGWAAVLRNQRYADGWTPSFSEQSAIHIFLFNCHHHLSDIFHKTGPVIALCFLLLRFCRAPFDATVLFFSAVYLLGYTALQCHSRHTFHLAFLPLLLSALLLKELAGLIFRPEARQEKYPLPVKQYLIRCIAGVALLSLIIAAPLSAARLYQTKVLPPLFQSLLDAPKTPVKTNPEKRYGWTFYRISPSAKTVECTNLSSLYKLLSNCYEFTQRAWKVHGRYFVAEFDGNAELDMVVHKYSSYLELNDFSQCIRTPVTKGSGKTRYYFFPAYELASPDHTTFTSWWGRYMGPAFPDELADSFRGLYEIQLPQSISRLISFTSFDGKIPDPLYYSQSIFPDPLYYFQYEQNSHDYINTTWAARRMNRETEKRKAMQALALTARTEETKRFILYELILTGKLDATLQGLYDLYEPKEDYFSLLKKYLLLVSQSFLSGQYKEDIYWEEGCSLFSKNEMATPFPENNILEKLLFLYTLLLESRPDDTLVIDNVSTLLFHKSSPERAVDFWRTLLQRTRDSAYFYFQLGNAYDAVGNYEKAQILFRGTHRKFPKDNKAAIVYAAGTLDTLDLEKLQQILDNVCESEPSLRLFAAERLERTAVYLSDKGQHNKAADLLIAAIRYAPAPDLVRLKASQQLVGAGKYIEAEQQLVPLLTTDYAEEAVRVLSVATTLSMDFPEQLNYWALKYRKHPDVTAIIDILNGLYAPAARKMFLSQRFNELWAIDLTGLPDSQESRLFRWYQDSASFLFKMKTEAELSAVFSLLAQEKTLFLSDLQELTSALPEEQHALTEQAQLLRVFLETIE